MYSQCDAQPRTLLSHPRFVAVTTATDFASLLSHVPFDTTMQAHPLARPYRFITYMCSTGMREMNAQRLHWPFTRHACNCRPEQE